MRIKVYNFSYLLYKFTLISFLFIRAIPNPRSPDFFSAHSEKYRSCPVIFSDINSYISCLDYNQYSYIWTHIQSSSFITKILELKKLCTVKHLPFKLILNTRHFVAMESFSVFLLFLSCNSSYSFDHIWKVF